MRPNTITPTDCGNCKHWHERQEECHKYVLQIGDCDKIAKGTPMQPTEDGTIFEYDGYSFEDENYNEEWGCFEQPKEEE